VVGDHGANDTLSQERYNAWGITAVGGLHQFYGDISDNTFFHGSSMKGHYNWQAGAQIRYDLNPKFGARLDYSTGAIWAQHPKTKNYFGATVRDAEMVGILNLTNIVMPFWYDKPLNVDIGFGVGYMQYSTDYQTANDSLINYVRMEIAPIWSLHGNISYRLSSHWDIGLQVSLKNTPIDDLDGLKNVYTELDKYSNVSIGLTYTFGSSDQAHKWNPKPYPVVKQEQDLSDLRNRLDVLEDDKADLEKDSDNDGVPDIKDQEPNSRPGCFYDALGRAIGPIGLVDSLGRPLPVKVVGHTADNTAASTTSTTSTTTPATTNTTSSEVKYTGTFNGFYAVYFASDKSDFSNSLGRFTLYTVAVIIRDNPSAIVTLRGNTDPRASAEYNQALSDLRCRKIKHLLTSYGVDGSRIILQAFGEKNVLFQRTNEANRRVDIIITQ
jgi:outer membrane protein OmpA-like peptidoglycan-associated protein